MLVYNYHYLTHEYTGSSEADLDEMETEAQGEPVYLLPANATFTPVPGEPAPGNHWVFVNDAWYEQAIPVDPGEPGGSEEPGEAPVSLKQVAGARLFVDQEVWDVTGVDRSVGISGAFLVDTDLVYVFFTEEAIQPDTYYQVIPPDGVVKHTDFVEVSRPGLAELNFIIQRVQ